MGSKLLRYSVDTALTQGSPADQLGKDETWVILALAHTTPQLQQKAAKTEVSACNS